MPPAVTSDVTAVVLAGGMGTRIRALYPDVPKPLIPVDHQPFLFWLTAFLARHGLDRFIYSTGYLGEQIEAWTKDGSFPKLDRRTRHETEPLGTGGGVLHCLDLCGPWALVANGDSVCLGGVDALLELRAEGLDGGLVGVRQEDTSRYGSLEVDAATGQLRAFREKVPGRGYVNGGTYLFRTQALRELGILGPSSIERDVIPALLASGRRLGVIRLADAPFIDIGTPETVAQATAFVRAHRTWFEPALSGQLRP